MELRYTSTILLYFIHFLFINTVASKYNYTFDNYLNKTIPSLVCLFIHLNHYFHKFIFISNNKIGMYVDLYLDKGVSSFIYILIDYLENLLN